MRCASQFVDRGRVPIRRRTIGKGVAAALAAVVAGEVMCQSVRGQCIHAHLEAQFGQSPPSAARRLGRAVSIFGDVAVAGAPAELTSGRAHVYARANGLWSQTATLQAADAGANAIEFGIGVSVYGDTIIVGAARGRNALNAATGAAYVFVRSGSVWVQQSKLAPGGTAQIGFGRAVAVREDQALIGAPSDDLGFGAAYVFDRSGSAWSESAKLVPSVPVTAGSFGLSVSLSTTGVLDSACVGAPGPYPGGISSGSAAYVFTWNPILIGATWNERSRLVPSDPAVHDGFGVSVAILGSTAVVGAPLSRQAGVEIGGAYVFTGNIQGGSWAQRAKIVPSDGALYDEFGSGVGLASGTIAVGAAAESSGRGAAYVFTGSGVSWTERVKVMGTLANERFGSSAALSGASLIIGSPEQSLAGATAGSVSLFDIGACPADANCDFQFTPADVAAFVTAWSGSIQNGTLGGDFDGNGVVNPSDVGAFVNAWFAALTFGC